MVGICDSDKETQRIFGGMKMYGELKNGILFVAPMPLKTAEWDIFTNDPAVYFANGYKPIIMTEYPSDGGCYAESWTETDTEITQVWSEIPQSDDDPISADEALNIITGGAV